MTTDDAGRLLEWMKGMARDMAHELREAGWEEDERGLWSLPQVAGWSNQFDGLHLFDAHEEMKRGQASQHGA